MDLGRHREALPHTEEAVTLWRALADPDTGDPTAPAGHLAMAERTLRRIREAVDGGIPEPDGR